MLTSTTFKKNEKNKNIENQFYLLRFVQAIIPRMMMIRRARTGIKMAKIEVLPGGLGKEMAVNANDDSQKSSSSYLI